MSGYDVIILGLGAMGTAAADELSRRGRRVLGLEQFSIPHALGSSHGESRMIRMAYYENPDYVPLLRRAYQRWHELEDRADAELLHITGGLYIGPGDCELIAGSLAAAREHRLAHELLDHATLRKRFSLFHPPDDYVALLEPMAGFLEPEKCIAAFAKLARRQSADLREHTAVRDWSIDAGGVTVRTERETFHAEQLLVTAGAWTGRLIQSLSTSLSVTRQTLSWFRPNDPQAFALGGFPVWAMHRPEGGIYYGFPMLPGKADLKVAIHAAGEPADAVTIDRQVHDADSEELREVLPRVLPAAGPAVASTVCMYSNSPDGHFIVDRLEDRVTIACGFSGHGFKFASVMGEVLADLVENGSTRLPAQFLSRARLTKI